MKYLYSPICQKTSQGVAASLAKAGAGQIPVDEMCTNRPPRRYFAHAKLIS